MAHAYVYRFLADDAFISFRYARNLAQGHGLVFNPGGPRVEGYTNFLWVLLLSGVAFLGAKPESAASVLSLLATIGLFTVVAREAWRTRPAGGGAWLVVIPTLFLAATRSVAVWSTSGLETRLFELLIVAGVLKLAREVEACVEGAPPRVPWAALWLALATLTRPDGLLIALAVFAVAAFTLLRRGKFAPRAAVSSGLVYAGIVGSHLAFRLVYYGEWLPNTYYAKVAGESWWSMGLSYLAAFTLEYGVWLWLPVIGFAVRDHVRRGTAFRPALYGAAVLPHALYVAAIGGDHFEYRPLDLYFPFALLLVYDGIKAMWDRRVLRIAALAWLLVALIALVDLPWQSHRQRPIDADAIFPGLRSGTEAAARYLAPGRDPFYRYAGLRWIAESHRRLLRRLTSRSAGIRQEEHEQFTRETAVPEGKRLAALVAEGMIPEDTQIAVGAAGAVPYISALRALDRYGLNDAVVARAGSTSKDVAHARHASVEYAAQIGVDFWPLNPARLVWAGDDLGFLFTIDQARRNGVPAYIADAGQDRFILAILPTGAERTVPRFPRLKFSSVQDDEQINALIARAVASHRRRVEQAPGDRPAQASLAAVLELSGDREGAFAIYRTLADGGDVDAIVQFADACARAGRFEDSIGPLNEAIRRSPDYARPTYDLGVAYVKLGDPVRGRVELESAVRKDPMNPDARFALGVVALGEGRRDLSLEQYEVLRSLESEKAPELLSAIEGAP